MDSQYTLWFILFHLIATFENRSTNAEVVKPGRLSQEASIPSLSAISGTQDAGNSVASTNLPRLLQSSQTSADSKWSDLANIAMSSSNLSRRQTLNPNAIPFVVPLGNLRIPGDVNIVAPANSLRNLLIETFLEMLQLSLAALGNIGLPGSESSSFLRYFRAEDVCVVRQIFQAILGPNNLGPAEINWYTLYWNAFDPLDVSHDHRCTDPAQLGVAGGNYPPTAADPQSRRADMTICPRMDWVKLDASFCNLLPDPQHPKMANFDKFSIAQTMLHEFTHWRRVIDYLAGGNIGDFNTDPNTINPQAIPRNGYGPYNSMLVNKNGFESTQNADNYAWFALESYLLKPDMRGIGSKTGWKEFEDPDGMNAPPSNDV